MLTDANMLFTVYVENLLLARRAERHNCSNSKFAIAFQLLDYPLIVLRGAQAETADTFEFRKGKAAVLNADEQELKFLLSHVPTTALLLDISNSSEHPRLVAMGQVALQGSHDAAAAATVHSQTVVLRDATQQPVACAELYASLQPGNFSAQVQVNVDSFKAADIRDRHAAIKQQEAQQLQLQPHPPPSAAEYNSSSSLSGRRGVGLQLQPPLLTYLPHPLGIGSSCDAQPIVLPAVHEGTVNIADAAMDSINQYSLQLAKQIDNRIAAAGAAGGIVLQHKRLPDTSATATRHGGNGCTGNDAVRRLQQQKQRNIQQPAPPADSQLDSDITPGHKIRQKRVASRSTVLESAAKASQILSRIRPDSSSPQRNRINQERAAVSSWLSPKKSAAEGFWDKLLRQMSPNKGLRQGSGSPLRAAGMQRQQQAKLRAGPRLQGLSQLKQQQAARRQRQQQWDQQQQRGARGRTGTKHRDAATAADYSDDGSIEIDDISCSLTAVLDDADDTRRFPVADAYAVQGPQQAVVVEQLCRVSQQAQDKPCRPDLDQYCQYGDSSGGGATGQWHYELRQPPPPTVPDRQQQERCSSPDQQHPHNSSRPLASSAGCGSTANAAAGGGCASCAATLTAAAQLLQASQAAAAAGSSSAQPQQPGQQRGHSTSGVSMAASVVWELVTLMSLRAVMSQAVSGMAEQMAGVVSQAMQRAVAAAFQTPAVPWLNNAAAAAPGMATGQLQQPGAHVPARAAVAQQPWKQWGMMGPVADSSLAVQQDTPAPLQQEQQRTAQQDVQQQQHLTPHQLQEQQEDLQKQFQQLEALLVVRDDSSSSSSSSSSSTGSTHSSRHGSRRHTGSSTSSSRHRTGASFESGGGSPYCSISGLQQYKPWSARSSTSDTGDRSPQGGMSGTISGMVVRLRRTTSDRPTSPLSRSCSAGATRGQPGTSVEEAPAGSAAAGGTVVGSTKLAELQEQQQQQIRSSPSAAAVTAVVPAAALAVEANASHSSRVSGCKGRSDWLSLPPLRQNTASGVGADAALVSAGSALLHRRNFSVASVDTNGSYDDDFESAASSAQPSPRPATGQQQQQLGATAASANLALLRKQPSQSKAQEQATATAPAAAAVSKGSGSPNNPTLVQIAPVSAGPNTANWVRNSQKLERRGSELPEIPEIPEEPDTDSEFDREADCQVPKSGVEAPSEENSGVASAGWHAGGSRQQGGAHNSSMYSKQQQVAAGGATLPAVVSFISNSGSASRSTSLRYQPDRVDHSRSAGDTLDALTDSILEDILPPGPNSGAGLSAYIAPTGSFGNAGARTMAAALPSKTRTAQTAVRPFSSNSMLQTTVQPSSVNAVNNAVAAVHSSLSVGSAVDDLLASSDLAMSSPRAATSAANYHWQPMHLQPLQQQSVNTAARAGAAANSTVCAAGVAAGHATNSYARSATASNTRTAAAAAAQERRFSNYSDVSFLSDDEEEAASAADAQQQQHEPRHSARRTDSGLSYMSSLDGSDVDIDYSVESAAPGSTITRPATRHGTQQPQPRQQQQPRGSNVGKPQAAGMSTGIARSAADVFYSHVSGTPTWSR